MHCLGNTNYVDIIAVDIVAKKTLHPRTECGAAMIVLWTAAVFSIFMIYVVDTNMSSRKTDYYLQ